MQVIGTQEYVCWSCERLAAALRRGELRAVDVLETFIDRISSKESKRLNAVVVTNFEEARRRAAEADAAHDQGRSLGILHGVPMTVKEEFDVKGLTTCKGRGSTPDDKGGVAQENSPGVQRLIDAGAIIMGKTNVPVGCLDWDTYNRVYGATSNPWDEERTPGGSSGGSAAALAACLVPLEFGGDTAGSIRVPAAFCGVLGHSPTFDLVPWANVQGVPAVNPEPFSGVAGPMARESGDLLLALDVLAALPPLEARGMQLAMPEPKHSLSGCRIAVWNDDLLCPVSKDLKEVIEATKHAVRKHGGTLIEDEFAYPKAPFTVKDSFETYLNLLGAKGAPDEYTSKDVKEGPLGQVAHGRQASHAEWKKFNGIRHEFRIAWHHFFSSDDAPDVVLCPIVPGEAWITSRTAEEDAHTAGKMFKVDDVSRPYADNFFWPHFAIMSGLPATSFRAGWSRNDLPLGLQVMGAPYMDRVTISVAGLLMQALEEETSSCGGWKLGPPPPQFRPTPQAKH